MLGLKKMLGLKFFFILSLWTCLKLKREDSKGVQEPWKSLDFETNGSLSLSLDLETWKKSLSLEVETLKKKSCTQSRSWDYTKKVSVSKLRLNKRKSRSRSRDCKPSLADLCLITQKIINHINSFKPTRFFRIRCMDNNLCLVWSGVSSSKWLPAAESISPRGWWEK